MKKLSIFKAWIYNCRSVKKNFKNFRKFFVNKHFVNFYFLSKSIQGSMDTPVENHMYSTNYECGSSINRLTRGSHHHTELYLNIESNVFVSIYSSIDRPPICEVYRLRSGLTPDAPKHPLGTDLPFKGINYTAGLGL